MVLINFSAVYYFRALYSTILFYLVLFPVIFGTGLTMYAVYEHCDPLKSGKIAKPDQIVPLFVVEHLSHLPGIPGLFVACVFSASIR